MVRETRPTPHRLLEESLPFLGGAPDLADLAPLLLPRLPDVADAFYDAIRASAQARRFIRGEAEFGRLRASLVAWLESFLSAGADAAARAGMAVRMAQAHHRIGIPLDITLLGHFRLRALVLGELLAVWPDADDREGLAGAHGRLSRAFDFDAILLVSSYHAVALRRERASTERLGQMNQRLQEAVRAQELLLRTTSHELRTPLTGLLGLLNLLRRGAYEDPAERGRVEEDLLGAARHLLALVDDLLALARIEVGKARLEPRDFDAFEAARLVVRRFAPRFAEAGLALELREEAGKGAATVRADPERHAQVLSNLLQNALQHTSRGGVTVEIEAGSVHGHVLTRVRDTGAGIPADVLPRLFEPFAQGMGRAAGLGLGLAICRRLVLRMGGRIRARSEGPGRGATFEFTLPAAGRCVDASERFGRPDARHRILLVDDDGLWRRDLARLLAERLPAQVLAVAGADDALEAARRESWQLMLLDVALAAPEGARSRDGLDLLEALACLPASLLVPKWLVSAHDPAFLAPELERSWHDAYWEKARILAGREAFVEAVRDQLGAGARFA